MATRIDITLERLHELRDRIDHQELEGEDWVVVGALVAMLVARTEARRERQSSDGGSPGWTQVAVIRSVGAAARRPNLCPIF
jgi:hypothetical protein